MKTKEELNALKKEVESLSGKIRELSDEELEQVTGGFMVDTDNNDSLCRKIMDWFFKIKN